MTIWYGLNHLPVNQRTPYDTDLTSVEGVETSIGFIFEWGFEQSGIVVEFSTIVGQTLTVGADHQLTMTQGLHKTSGYVLGAGFGEQVPIDRGIQDVESQTMGQQVTVSVSVTSGSEFSTSGEEIQLVDEADPQKGLSTLVSGSGFEITVFPDWIAISSAESIWTPIIVEP